MVDKGICGPNCPHQDEMHEILEGHRSPARSSAKSAQIVGIDTTRGVGSDRETFLKAVAGDEDAVKDWSSTHDPHYKPSDDVIA